MLFNKSKRQEDVWLLTGTKKVKNTHYVPHAKNSLRKLLGEHVATVELTLSMNAQRVRAYLMTKKNIARNVATNSSVNELKTAIL
jgi:hypothetical protein